MVGVQNKAFYCLLGLLPLLVIFTQWDFVFHQASLPRYFLAVVWSLIAVVIYVRRIALTLPIAVLSVFFSWACVSVIWGGSSLEHLIALSHWLILLILTVTLLNVLKEKGRVNYLLWIILGALLLSSFIGLYQAFSGKDFIYLQLAPPSASFVNRNFAASAAMMLLPFAIWKAVFSQESNTSRLSLLVLLGAMLLFFYIGIVQSRGVLLAIVGFCCLFLLWKRINQVEMLEFNKNRSVRLLVLLAALVVGWMVSPAQKSLDILNPDSSINIRYDTWQSSVEAFKENPIFGHGVGSFRAAAYQSISGEKLRVASSEDRQITHAHNEYLEILVELGVVGLSLWIFLMVLLIRQLFRISALNVNVVALLGLSGVAIHSFFSFPLHNGGTALIAACLLAVSQFDEKPVYALNRIKIVKVGFVLGLVLIVCGFSLFFTHSSSLSKVFQLGKKSIDCENLAVYELSLGSSYWLTDYPSRSVYSQALSICKKRSAKSNEFIEELANADATFVRGHLMLAEKELQNGEYHKVEQRMNSLLVTHRELVEPWLMLVKVASEQGDLNAVNGFLKNAEVSGNKSDMVNWYRTRFQSE